MPSANQQVRAIRRAIVAYSIRNRRRKAAAMTGFLRRVDARTLVFAGAGLARAENEAIVERALSAEAKVLFAYDVNPGEHSEYPVHVADGRALPYDDDCADLVLANAVVEHVGDRHDQQRFVDEQARIGRDWIITTPNRWFPVESHTGVLFLHWLPSWRARNAAHFSRLLSLREFRALFPTGSRIVGRPWSPTFTAYSR